MKIQQTIKILLGIVLCILILNCPTWADGSFIDDFSDGDIGDGSPVMWQWAAELGPIGGQMVTPEGFRLTPEGTAGTTRSWRFARDKYGMPVQYAGDVTIRAQMKIPVDGPGDDAQNHSSVFLGLRFDMNQDTGYWIALNSHFFWLARLGGPDVDPSPGKGYSSPWAWHYDSLGRVDFSQDVIVQLDITDIPDNTGSPTTSRLEARYWAAGSQMPEKAQIVAHDPHFDVGEIGIGTSSIGKDRTVIVRWVEVIGNKIDPPVDFNGSGTVDIKDLEKMIESWGQDDPALDLVPDGVVGEQDLKVLMDFWQQEVNDVTLKACWKLDESEGNVAYDSAGQRDAQVQGDAQWLAMDGQVNGALRFDGLSNYLDAPLVIDPASNGPFSVFAWVRGGLPGQVILSQAEGMDWLVVDPESGLLKTGLTQPAKNVRGKITEGPALTSSVTITDGNWHRVGIVRDGVERILYVDDVEVARDSISTLAPCQGPLCIGADSTLEPGSFWLGTIDDVRIYNRVVVP